MNGASLHSSSPFETAVFGKPVAQVAQVGVLSQLEKTKSPPRGDNHRPLDPPDSLYPMTKVMPPSLARLLAIQAERRSENYRPRTPGESFIVTNWKRSDIIYINMIPLLPYTHRNRVELQKTLQQILSLLSDPQKAPPPKEQLNEFFRLPIRFIEDEHHIRLGDALILHLRLAIEQQTKKRKGGVGGKIKESDSTIAGWLHTSTRTIQRYKSQLKEAGLLNITIKGVTQELSVRYYTKPVAPITPTLIT
jgi:hypothetical protein